MFPEQRRSKLMPRGDGPYQIIEMTTNNAYKVDLPGEYGVSGTFNVFDLFLFDTGDDSRLKPFEERGDDAIQPSKDLLEVSVGPNTRLRSSKQLSINFFKIHGLRWTSRGFVIINSKP